MKVLAKFLLLIMIFVSCNVSTNRNSSMNEKTDTLEKKETIINDTIPKVTGIGGIFFQSKNPQETRDWYGKNLRLAIDDYGSPFEFRNANNPEEIN